MKALSIITICMATIFLARLLPSSFSRNETLDKIMGDGIVERLEEGKNSNCEYFNVPINNSNSNLLYREDGKVYVRLNKGEQTFDITKLQQLHRLEDLKNFMQQIK